MGSRLFLVCSRILTAVYGRFPIFGRLRASLAVVWREGRLLAVDRSDRLGIGFPGGIAMPWESDETVMRRELREETGMRAISARLLFYYEISGPIPALIAVFAAAAEGEPRGSWEGTAQWITREQMKARLFPLHAPALARLESDGFFVTKTATLP